MFTIYSPNIQALRYFQFFNLFSRHNFSKAFFVLFSIQIVKKLIKIKEMLKNGSAKCENEWKIERFFQNFPEWHTIFGWQFGDFLELFEEGRGCLVPKATPPHHNPFLRLWLNFVTVLLKFLHKWLTKPMEFMTSKITNFINHVNHSKSICASHHKISCHSEPKKIYFSLNKL